MGVFDEIINSFNKEFSFLKDKFECVTFPVTNKPNDKIIYNAGVYLFYMGGSVWKIGKSNDNATKRAYQHFRDDTGQNIGKGMKKYENDPAMKLVLFVLKDLNDLHWLFALECFFEIKFRKENNLEIRAGRLG